MEKGKIYVIGCGPGARNQLTYHAIAAINESHFILSYKTYIELISTEISSQTVIPTGMTETIEQAQEAIEKAEQGYIVSILSSGDASVYGMAGIVYETLHSKNWNEGTGIAVEIIPGISALTACASLIGAPLMHDHCSISLNEKTTPWSIIEKRIEGAAIGDFMIAFYNPKNGYGTTQMQKIQSILLTYRAKDTPVGIVRGAFRPFQEIIFTTIDNLIAQDIGMVTTIFIGNQGSYIQENRLMTPRSYHQKITINTKTFPTTTEIPKEKIPNKIQASSFETVFEVAISPGVANKFYNAKQLAVLSQLVTNKGTVEYTADHKMILKIPTNEPQPILDKLEEAEFLISPVGHIVNIKACDFCHGEKTKALPYAEQLEHELGGIKVPMPLNIGFNGCSMTCYGAVFNDIGIIYRKRNFDLYIGAKSIGKTAHAAKFVAEGIEMENLVPTITRIVKEYQENAHSNERLYQFFKRTKIIGEFTYG